MDMWRLPITHLCKHRTAIRHDDNVEEVRFIGEVESAIPIVYRTVRFPILVLIISILFFLCGLVLFFISVTRPPEDNSMESVLGSVAILSLLHEDKCEGKNRTIALFNKCPHAIWPGIQGNSPLVVGDFELIINQVS